MLTNKIKTNNTKVPNGCLPIKQILQNKVRSSLHLNLEVINNMGKNRRRNEIFSTILLHTTPA